MSDYTIVSEGIDRLRAENAELAREVERLTGLVRQTHEALVASKKERDELRAALKQALYYHGVCDGTHALDCWGRTARDYFDALQQPEGEEPT